MQSIVLEPQGQGPVRWQLLGCDRALSVLGAVVKQVESLHRRTVSRREEDLLPSSQQAPRLVCVGEEHLPVPDRDDVFRYRVRIRVRQMRQGHLPGRGVLTEGCFRVAQEVVDRAPRRVVELDD